TAPIPVAAIHDRLRNTVEDVGHHDAAAGVPHAERPATVPIGTWKPDLIERRRVQPWYRTKAAAATLAGAALAPAAAVSSVLLVPRGSDHTTSVAPQPSTTGSPPPSAPAPVPSRAPAAALS